MNAVSLIGVVSAFGLVFLWLLALCAEKGMHPPRRVRDGFGRLPVWEKMLLSLFVGAWLVFASEKNDGTNGVNQVEGDTNMVTQVEDGTNQMENGEWRMENAGGVFSILRSPFSILHSNEALPGNAITGDDVERMFRVATTFDGNLFAEPTANAVTNASWLDYGGMSDTFRLLPEGWRFPFAGKTTTGLTVFENGEFRPNVKTHFFPPPFDAKLSLLPRMNWGLLPNGGESVFWHEQTPSNSLVLTWHNALYNRDVNSPTNFQAELFADGRFDYRYPDHTVQYAPVFPFDWDGDGLENSVDPEPLVAGSDAHGTNVEWYNVVCSNVFAAVEGAQGVELAPRAVGVKTNAYYFVDVVAQHGPAPIYFNSSHPGRLGSPVVVAYGGVTNRVPLLVGAAYSVTSDVPFTVAYTTNGFAEVTRPDGRNATVRWPLNFTFTEELSGTNRTYTVDVGPYNPGGSFSWGWSPGGASLQGVAPSSAGSCGCVSGNGNTVTFGCSPSCTCGGNCLAVGAFSFEYAVFAVTGGVCRCGFDDPPAPEQPTFGPLDEPTLSVSFSAPAVIFEDAYVDSPGVTRPRRSTRTRLTVSAWGGPNGGTLTLTSQNLDKLSPVACGPMVLPPSVTLAPYQAWSVSCLCEGAEASVAENDVVVSGVFSDHVAGCSVSLDDQLTIVRIEIQSTIDPPEASSCHLNRHIYGVCENVRLFHYPTDLNNVIWNPVSGGNVIRGNTRFVCPLYGCDSPLRVEYGSVVYSPQLSVVEPQSVLAVLRYGNSRESIVQYASKGESGGIGMLLKLYVRPFSVSFSEIKIQEVPCLTYRASGYFTNPYFNGAFAHTSGAGGAGAGNWTPVLPDNLFGYDTAAYTDTIPWLTERGRVTADAAYAWTEGYVCIDNPFGWNSKEASGDDPPYKTFATDVQDEILLEPDGLVGVRKLFNQVTRSTNDVIHLNGVLLK